MCFFRYLYWTHTLNDQGYIEQCDDHGSSRQIVLKRNFIEPISITQNADYLFYSENMSIMQLHKFKGNESRVYKHTSVITDVRVVDSAKQGGWNQCAVNNGNCKYLCLVRPGFESPSTDFECACPTHYTMRGDSCYPPDRFLLLSHRHALYRLSLNAAECLDFPMPISGKLGLPFHFCASLGKLGRKRKSDGMGRRRYQEQPRETSIFHKRREVFFDIY